LGNCGLGASQGWIWRTRAFLAAVFGPAEAQLFGGVALIPTENLEQVVAEHISRLEALVQRLDRVEPRLNVDAIRKAGEKARREDEPTEPPDRIEREAPLEPYWENRRLLAIALKVAYRDGLFWYDKEVQPTEWAHWQRRTTELIEAALGEPVASRFSTVWENANDPKHVLTGLEALLQHLWDLIHEVDSVARRVKLQPDFDGRDWVSRR